VRDDSYIIAREALPMLFLNSPWFYPGVTPVQMPVGLKHLESDVCWCDPLMEVDENGHVEVLHRQVTWN
jgi:hypothetical protein